MAEQTPGATRSELQYDPDYFDNYSAVPAYRSKFPDENIIRFLAANFPADKRSGKKALDLGCGCGRHLVALHTLGFTPHGVDGSEVAVAASHELVNQTGFRADVRVASLTALPYDDNHFDVVIENSALVNNSWPDILAACREAHRVLKKGGIGYFLLKRPNDCAFTTAEPIENNGYLVEESVYISTHHRSENKRIIFHSFSEDDLQHMFEPFSKVTIHSWETSFKSLHVDDTPGERLTSYWVILVRK